MTAEQLERLQAARNKYWEISQQRDKELAEHSTIIREILKNCDHLKPDGTSAVRCMMGVSCEICHVDNEYGCLDEHLHKHHGWKMPERDAWGMIRN